MTEPKNDGPDLNLGSDAAPVTSASGIAGDRLENEDILRGAEQQDMENPNDEPGFADGVQGGWDGEDRQGDPSALTGSDLAGEERGGAGTSVGGGIDGGPARR